jgi:hypothetical protein
MRPTVAHEVVLTETVVDTPEQFEAADAERVITGCIEHRSKGTQVGEPPTIHTHLHRRSTVERGVKRRCDRLGRVTLGLDTGRKGRLVARRRVWHASRPARQAQPTESPD